MKNNEIIYHFELIDNYEKLKEIVSQIGDYELKNSLKLISSKNLEDQVKVSEALTRLLNFTDKYNEILNDLNIYNNTEKCNELCKDSMEQLQKESLEYKNTLSDVEVRCHDIKVNQQHQLAVRSINCDDKIQQIIIAIDLCRDENKPFSHLEQKLSKLKIEEKEIHKEMDYLEYKTEVLRGETKEKKNLFNFFSKDKKITLTENEKNIVNKKEIFEKSEFKDFELKYNSLIIHNNKKLKLVKERIDIETMRINSLIIKKLINGGKADFETISYGKRLFRLIVDHCNSINNKITNINLDEINIKNPNINLINYLTDKIQERNKLNYNNFIATSLDDVMFTKNTHIEKLNNNVNYKIQKELEHCKSINYASGMVFSGLAKISKLIFADSVVKPIESLSKILKESAKVYNKELAEVPYPSIDKSTKIIDEMFEKFSFNITNKNEFNKYIDKFDKVKLINIHKKDVLEIS